MSSRSRLTRPKSIATVVVVLSGVDDRSSTSVLAWVITASVVSGMISETDPTNVVFPTPKPPPTMILTEVMPEFRCPEAAPVLELAKSTENPFQQLEVRLPLSEGRLMQAQQAFVCHVRDEHTGYTERQSEQGRHFRHRTPVTAQIDDGFVLGGESRDVLPRVRRDRDERLERQVVPRLGAAAGDRVRPDQRTRVSRLRGRRGRPRRRVSVRTGVRPGQGAEPVVAVPAAVHP